jgi:outer membrane beta-barrel protein
MRHFVKQLGIGMGFFFFYLTAMAADSSSSTPQVIAIQGRGYSLINEMTLKLGYLPLDSFNRYVSYGASYTHYFNGFEAWEVLNLEKAINYDTGLTAQLQKSFLVSTYPFNTLDYFATTSFLYNPFFNKSLFMDSSIVKGETAFLLGGGMAKFDGGFINEADAGVIFRFFMGPQLSLKIDFRYHFYFSSAVTNNMQLGAGLSYSFGNAEANAAEKEMELEKAKEKESDD